MIRLMGFAFVLQASLAMAGIIPIQWTAIGPEVGDLCRTESGRLFIATSSGLLASDDSGLTWSATSINDKCFCVKQGPDGVLLVGAAAKTYPWPDRAYWSTDGGATWNQTVNYSEISNSNLTYALARTPDGTIFAATVGGLLKLSPESTTWVDLTTNASILSVFRARDGSLYYSDESLLSYDTYKSSDNGNSWSILPALHGRVVKEMVETPDERLFIAPSGSASFNGFYSSSDHGASWGFQDIPSAYLQDMAVGTSGEVYMGGFVYVYRLDNGILDKAVLGNGNLGFTQALVQVVEQAPDGHLLGICNSTLYRSDIAVPEPATLSFLLVLVLASARRLR